jgi:hypothetical protein
MTRSRFLFWIWNLSKTISQIESIKSIQSTNSNEQVVRMYRSDWSIWLIDFHSLSSIDHDRFDLLLNLTRLIDLTDDDLCLSVVLTTRLKIIDKSQWSLGPVTDRFGSSSKITGQDRRFFVGNTSSLKSIQSKIDQSNQSVKSNHHFDRHNHHFDLTVDPSILTVDPETPSIGHLLALHWLSIGSTLALYWLSDGLALLPFQSPL